MAGLYKKEVVIRPTSTITVQGAKDWTKNWLNNTFQEADSNKNSDGTYTDYFFGDIFDSRTGNIYRVFSDACADEYALTTLEFEILDTSKFAKEEELSVIEETLVEHTDRIVALEQQDAETTAVVI